tara:strand:+ start:1581 stop:2177 length:597 start_codon:yes stop_codon:yes gene_type:complete
MAKYKIVPKEVVQNIIEFLDEVQLDASKGNSVDDLHKINFINWAIGELMNSLDGYDSKNDNPNKNKDAINNRRSDIIDDYFIDWELPEDMTDEEFEKMVTQFDAFLRGWEKEYKKSNPKKNPIKRNGKTTRSDIIQHMSLKEVEKFLLDDPELTDNERFELYYDERERQKPKKSEEKGISYKKMLKDLNISPPDKKSK